MTYKDQKKCEVLCFYLPQFHETLENNMWWGEGYTEWTAVKNARSYLKGQRQPHCPLSGNYYDLSDESARAWKWQSELAKQYGIDGFVIYHYWFAGKKVLNKPVEILLQHKEVSIKYSLCWDNNEWRRTWFGNKDEILIPQEYGDREIWKKHFDDLLPFFKDKRYIKIDNKPVFHIYASNKIPCLKEMIAYWNWLAGNNGFAGVYIIVGDYYNRKQREGINAYYNFEPNRIQVQSRFSTFLVPLLNIKNGIRKRINGLFKKEYIDVRNAAILYKLLAHERNSNEVKTYRGIWVKYDDTPRRQEKGIYYKGANPERFSNALYNLIIKSEKESLEFVYVNAWNEWGEGAYLEPDEEDGYKYLEAVADAVGKARKSR